jgi:hypothetical protein
MYRGWLTIFCQLGSLVFKESQDARRMNLRCLAPQAGHAGTSSPWRRSSAELPWIRLSTAETQLDRLRDLAEERAVDAA